MAVGAHNAVGPERVVLAAEDTAGKVLEVDLMHDPESRRHNAETLKGLHAPLEKAVALAVTLEFNRHVVGEGLGVAEVIDHHRVVHDHIHGNERLHTFGIKPPACGFAAHGSQVRQERNTG